MTQRIAVFPADRHSLYEEHGYSAAIRSGDLLFVSGQVGSHTDGTPEPDFQKQVRLAFENLKATLSAAGCTFDDIVDVTTFHTDPEQQLNDVMAVKQEIFALPPYPNWTAVGVTWLARNKGYCPNPLMLILGKTGSIICTGFILFIPALHPV